MLFGRAGTIHQAKEFGVCMLERDIEVTADVFMLGNHVDEFIGHAFGLDVHNAKPCLSEFLGKLSHQPCQGLLFGKIVPPPSGVLRNKDNLACTCVDSICDIVTNLIVFEAMVATSNIRDCAI